MRHLDAPIDEGDGLHLSLVGAVDAEQPEHGVDRLVHHVLLPVEPRDLLRDRCLVRLDDDGVALDVVLDDVVHVASLFSLCGCQIC